MPEAEALRQAQNERYCQLADRSRIDLSSNAYGSARLITEVMLDFTDLLRAGGTGRRDAIERVGEARFLPVRVTSVTAIGGLLPLALSGSGLYGPLAWVIIGRPVNSTLLSRVVTPVYLLIIRGTASMVTPEAIVDALVAGV